MRLTTRYAAAKEKIEQLARFKLAGATPAEQLLELTARVWVPGGRVGNDVANFGKGVHDALEKIVYRNDNQLRATHWLHAGVDVDARSVRVRALPLGARLHTAPTRRIRCRAVRDAGSRITRRSSIAVPAFPSASAAFNAGGRCCSVLGQCCRS
jgi:hypothetical protein